MLQVSKKGSMAQSHEINILFEIKDMIFKKKKAEAVFKRLGFFRFG